MAAGQRAISATEKLARFVLFRRHRANAAGVVPPEAFLPYKRVELSVTLHTDLSDKRLWGCGRCVAIKRNLTLYGRADISAETAVSNGLALVYAEPPRNHVNIVGWPAEKAAQMSYAVRLAATAVYFAAPS